jgi:hypothetical protein
MEMINTQIPPETTYESPAGNYSGSLMNVFTAAQESEDETIRCVFKLDVASMADKIVLVGKNLPPNSAKLRVFLERWLGREFIRASAGKVIDLNNLIGRTADITVLHINNPGYSKPFCNLAGAYPPGTLTLTEDHKENGGGI